MLQRPSAFRSIVAILTVTILVLSIIFGFVSLFSTNIALAALCFAISAIILVAMDQSNTIRDFIDSNIVYPPFLLERRYLLNLQSKYKNIEDYFIKLPIRVDPISRVPGAEAIYSVQASGPPQAAEHYDSLLDVLDRYPRFVLIGEPGAGKTTSVEHLVLEIANCRRNNRKSADLPVFLSLSDWRDQRKIDDLLRSEISELVDDLGILHRRDVILCLDGLNEMGASGLRKAEILRKWLISENCPSRIVVTCRSGEYTEGFDLGIPVAYLDKMSGESISEFATRRLGAQAKAFLSEIGAGSPEEPHTDDRLLQLARNPYMLVSLISIFLDSSQQDLPRNMGALIGKLIVLAWAQEQKKRQVAISTNEMKEAYSKLAFALIDKGLPLTFTRSFALEYLKQPGMLEAGYGAKLIDISGEQVHFYHQLILEYFSSLELEWIGIKDKLLPPVRFYPGQSRSKWEQSIIMLSGITQDVNTLVNQIAEIDILLAVKCITNGAKVTDELSLSIFSRALNPDDRDLVYDVLVQLNEYPLLETVPLLIYIIAEGHYSRPPNRYRAMEILEKVGPPAVDFLIVALENDTGGLRGWLARVLANIVDSRAIPIFTELLQDHSTFGITPIPVSSVAANGLRRIGSIDAMAALRRVEYPLERKLLDSGDVEAAIALKNLGWQPKDNVSKNIYFSAIGDFQSLVRSGSEGQLIAIQHLNNSDASVRKSAAQALSTVDWTPSNTDEAVSYYVAAEEWSRCLSLGSTIVDRLTAYLEDNSPYIRQEVARLLATLNYIPNRPEIAAKYYLALGDWRAYLRIKPKDLSPIVEILQNHNDKNAQALARTIILGYGKEAIPALSEQLKSEYAGPLIPVVELIGEIGDSSVAPLLVSLLDTRPYFTVCEAVIRSLGKLNEIDSIPTIRKFLVDESPSVRLESAHALRILGWQPTTTEEKAQLLVAEQSWNEIGKLGCVGVKVVLDVNEIAQGYDVRQSMRAAIVSTGNSCIDVLIEYLRNRHSLHIVIEALGEIGDGRAIPELLLLVRDGTDWDLSRIIEALGKLHSERYDAVEGLLELLLHEQGHIRISVVKALANCGDSRAIDPLLNLANSFSFEELYSDGGWTNKTLFDEITKTLQQLGWKPETDEQAIRFFIGLGAWKDCLSLETNATPILLEMFSGVRSHKIPPELIDILGELGDKQSVPLLTDLLTENSPVVPSSIAAKGLGLIGDQSVLPYLIDSLHNDSRQEVRAEAATAIGRLGNIRSVPSLVEAFLYDSGGYVRTASAQALKSLSWYPPDLSSRIAYAIALEDWNTCLQMGDQAAEQIIAMLADYQDLPLGAKNVLLELRTYSAKRLIAVARSSAGYSTRVKAVELLAEMNDAFETRDLVPLLADKDRFVRRATANVLAILKWQPSTTEDAINSCLASENWGLCQRLGVATIPRLIAISGDPGLKEHVVKVIVGMGEIAVPTLREMLRDQDQQYTSLVAEILELINRAHLEAKG